MPKKPHDHYDYRDQEHKQRDAVHAVHHLYINVPWIVWITLTNIQVSKNLIPDALFHKTGDFLIKLQKKSVKPIIFAAQLGN